MLAVLFVLAGGGEAMPRHVRTGIWRVLRPAEAAFRRLVVVECARMAHKLRASAPRGAPVGLVPKPRDSAALVPCFALFDPRKRFGIKRRTHRVGIGPRVWSPGMDDPVFDTWTPPAPDDVVSVAHVRRRMEALQAALGDLPKQARRLARWQAKREATRASSGKYIAPMRPGRPPGHRARKRHPVDFVLSDCHDLAMYALHPPDT